MMKCSELFFMKGKETFPEGLKSGWVGVEVGGGVLDSSKSGLEKTGEHR